MNNVNKNINMIKDEAEQLKKELSSLYKTSQKNEKNTS